MKIKSINEDRILFNNEKAIEFDHTIDCCEWNYADFKQIETQALNTEFDEQSLWFEAVPEAGFKFGSNGNFGFFIPCYSEQNGYYTSELNIYYDGKEVLSLDCELDIY